jgi:hypothetical protein
MSRPRFLADHDLRNAIVRGVRRRVPEAQFLRVRDFGLEQASDDEVLAFASEHGYIVVSHDVNSMSAAAKRRNEAGQAMHGLFLSPQRIAIRPVIDSLTFIWRESEAEEWIGIMQFLPL